jgi:predicted peptidase
MRAKIQKQWLKSGFSIVLSISLFISLFAASIAYAVPAADGIVSVRALTDMGWWGQRVTGVVLEFSESVDPTRISLDGFSVRDTAFNPYFDSGNFADPSFMRDQKVVDVFTVADPKLLLDHARPVAAGKYVVVMVEPNFNGGTKVSINSGMKPNPNQPTEVYINKLKLST